MAISEPRIIVIMPCLNEGGRIGSVVSSIKKIYPQATVLVIDDASIDGTVREARRAGAVVLSHGCNLGYGAALETGYLHALANNFDFVLQMDGDGQHLAEELPVLLKPLLEESADIVIGSRYLGNRKSRATTPLRKLGHMLFSRIVQLFGGFKMTDPTSGFQGLNRRALALYTSGVFPYDYPDSDVILVGLLSGLRIIEAPVVMVPRAGGVSMHAGLKPIYYVLKMLLSMLIVLLNYPRWRRWRKSSADKNGERHA